MHQHLSSYDNTFPYRHTIHTFGIAFAMKSFFIAIILLLCTALVMFSSSSMLGAARGFELFIANVFPALFPFFVCISSLKRLGAFKVKNSKPAMTVLEIFMLCCISGSPTGSLLVDNSFGGDIPLLSLRKRSILSAICNLSSPVFIIGAVCTNMLGHTQLAIPIAISHYGTSALLLILFMVFNRNKIHAKETHTIGKPIGLQYVLPESIAESMQTMLRLGGTLIFFSVIIGILSGFHLITSMPPLDRGLIFGIIEMTNGIEILACSGIQPRLTLSLISALLSLGGICIFIQASSVSKLSPLPYLGTKLFHAITAGALCYFIFPYMPDKISAVTNSFDHTLFLANLLTMGELALCGAFASSIAILFSIIISGKTRAS